VIAKDMMRNGHSIDLGVLLERALVHDLDESLTGDVLRTVKYGHPGLKQSLDEVSVRLLSTLEDELSIDILTAWRAAKTDDVEGDIIKVVDLLQVITYISEEINLGNLHVTPILSECAEYIRDVVKELGESPVAPYAKDIVDWVVKMTEVV